MTKLLKPARMVANEIDPFGRFMLTQTLAMLHRTVMPIHQQNRPGDQSLSGRLNDAAIQHHPSASPELSLASYNIHRCIGSDGIYDPGRIRAVLQELDADVVALQEVEVYRDDPGLLEYLCQDSGWQAIHGITLSRENGKYGNALLSRLPVEEVYRQDLSVGEREPRGALHAKLQRDQLSLRVIATHFGLRPGERRKQARLIARALDSESRAIEKPEVTVLMGDFNEWFLWGNTLRRLQRHFMPAPSPATFPSRFPLFALDRIWLTPGPARTDVKAVKSPLTRTASDHLPLLARVYLG